MIEKPKGTVGDLKGDTKKLMINLIREFSKDFANETHLGLEGAEEALTGLIDKGLVKIIYDEEQGRFYLTRYDFKTESYISNEREV